jgi:hypothetical protein
VPRTLLKINERFLLELNRVSYTFTASKRGALVEEIDQYTMTLDKFLSLQDGMLGRLLHLSLRHGGERNMHN